MFKSNLLRNSVCLLLSISFFIAGCGGQQANCVDRYMPGDENRSCASLFAEIQSIDTEIEQKHAKRRERDVWNVAEFVGGVFFLVPFFFMDAKGSYEQEIAALEARQRMLKIHFADNGCDVTDLDAPSIREVQKSIASERAKQIIGATNCGMCGKLLQPEDGVHIVKSKRICKDCYERSDL